MDGGATGIRPHRFTVADYHRMAETGILGEDSRVELIRGQIVDMAPIGAPHFSMVNRINRVLSAMVAGRAIVSVQNPVRIDDGSEPEPDVAIIKPRADEYETAIAGAADVLLLVEVADSSLDEDRTIKLPLYAESGIPECWLVNLVDRVIEVYRQPENGRYSQMRCVGPSDTLEIQALPGLKLPAGDLLRPPVAG
jgi:Uma2 family endonuclease